jgi:hypothetical protein
LEQNKTSQRLQLEAKAQTGTNGYAADEMASPCGVRVVQYTVRKK